MVLLVGLAGGCSGGNTPSAESHDAGSESTSSGVTTFSTDENSSTSEGTGAPVLLCTGQSDPVWCFEQRELSTGIVAFDLDGDGWDDFLATDEYGEKVQMYRNPDGHSEQLLWEMDSGNPPVMPRVHDLDGDGVPELLVAQGAGGVGIDRSVLLFRLSLDGATPLAEVPVEHNWYVGEFAILDANEDGHLDIVALADGAARMQILRGDGALEFEVLPEFQTEDTLSASEGVDWGDVDGDGHIDIAVPTGGTQSPTILFGDGMGQFIEHTNVPVEDAYRRPWLVDLDNDGSQDVLTSTSDGFAIAYSRPSRTFELVRQGIGMPPNDGAEPFVFQPVDLDGDGFPELVGFQDDLMTWDEQTASGHYAASLLVYSDITAEGYLTARSALFEDNCDDARENFFGDQGPLRVDDDAHPDLGFAWTTSCPLAPSGAQTSHPVALLYRP
ncbi:MAG TPA: VCBS repeat-containing protein [Nannocystaceae bacterium]|nr:VCBS repeat-containing protein [Nannocystaceae bacterium]